MVGQLKSAIHSEIKGDNLMIVAPPNIYPDRNCQKYFIQFDDKTSISSIDEMLKTLVEYIKINEYKQILLCCEKRLVIDFLAYFNNLELNLSWFDGKQEREL
jgi:hypothetical protein